MFYWIYINIINMMAIVFGIADGVLLKTWLPDIFQSTSMGELLFNLPPAGGKIIIAFG
ncbi:glutamate decarboxylase isozyme domain protein [Escherichia coli 99.1793]|nr:glutamate decarboxylase isozyme domain protein [Escherichia coli 99.1793]